MWWKELMIVIQKELMILDKSEEFGRKEYERDD